MSMKMGVALILNEETEALFRSKTIDEMKEISSKFSWSIGETRRELRSTVGERYRDLLSAAETIVKMNEEISLLSCSLTSLVADVEKISLSPSFRRDTNPTGATGLQEISPSNLPYLNVASQIKLLRDIPDLIWSHLEGDLYTSVQLYLLGSQVRTNLICSSQHDATIVKQNFLPLIQRQWESISHFRSTLLSSLDKKLALKGEDSTLLAGMVLLDPPDSPLSLYKNVLLKVRRSRLEDIVVSSISGKDYVAEILYTIRSTLLFLKSAFIDGDLRESLKDSQNPTLELHHLFTALSPISKFLPAVIKDFIPSVLLKETLLKAEDVREITREWLDEVHEFLKKETKSRILAHVSTIEGLASIRKRIYEMFSGLSDESRWDTACKEILGSSLNLWNEFFDVVFVERVESLIESKVGGSIYVIESKLDTLMKSNEVNNEMNLSTFIWSEGNGTKNELSMQTLCFSPEVQNLCSQFDSTFKNLLEDVSHYVATKSEMDYLKKSVLKKNSPEPFSLSANNEPVLQYVKTTISKHIKDLFSRINQKYSNQNNETPDAMLIHIGRLYQAIPEMSPFWLEALTKSVADDNLLSLRSKKDNILNELKVEFDHQSKLYFGYWKEHCIKVIDQSISFGDGDQKTYLEILPKWESVTISEESEDGNVVESVIRIPNQPSVVLVFSLNNICNIIYNVGPQSFPAGILNSFSHDICLKLLCVYEEKTVKKLQKIPQDVAFQILFDLKFIHHIMISGDSFELTEKYNDIINSVENHIDPFDLDVFSEHISNRVQKSSVAYQCLFGGIIPSNRFYILNSLKSVQTNLTSSKDQKQSHNLLNTAQNSKTRFPLLPIPTGGSSGQNIPRASLTRLVPDLNRKKSITKIAESNLSSGGFLSAVSSSWFGSK